MCWDTSVGQLDDSKNWFGDFKYADFKPRLLLLHGDKDGDENGEKDELELPSLARFIGGIKPKAHRRKRRKGSSSCSAKDESESSGSEAYVVDRIEGLRLERQRFLTGWESPLVVGDGMNE